MKKFLYMVTAVASLLATGCTEQIEPDPVPALNSQEVYFSNDLVTEYVIGKNVFGEGANSYVEIPIYRLVDTNDYTVSMRFAASEGFVATYDAPKFAAGQKESKLVISFDAGQLERGESAVAAVLLLIFFMVPFATGRLSDVLLSVNVRCDALRSVSFRSSATSLS